MKSLIKLITIISIISVIGVVTAISQTSGHAGNSMGTSPGKKSPVVSKIQGEIVDLACYLEHNQKGASHATCAAQCFANGIPVALLDNKGNLYTLVGSDMKPVSDFVKPNSFGKQVSVTGNIIKKGGSQFLIVTKVEIPLKR